MQTLLLFPEFSSLLRTRGLKLGDTMLALGAGIGALAERDAPLPVNVRMVKMFVEPPALRRKAVRRDE